MSISDTTENAILALIFNATAWANYADNAATSPQTQIAVAAHTADPGDTGTQSTSETTYTGYARVNVNRNSGGWTVSGTSPTTVNPVANIAFGVQSAGTPTLTFASVGKTGGGASAILLSGAISPNLAVTAGSNPTLTTATAITLD